MAFAVLEQAQRIREQSRVDNVGICGGVFQNRTLTGQVVELLQGDGFAVHLGKVLPCNDAALSFGQAAELAAREEGGPK
jgi:hydrogenase maturation protein HypF